MSIKLIAVDIDGTLLNSQRQVTPEVFQAIQDAKAAGVKVVIATGRPIPGVLPLLEELNLNQDGDYVITFNGGLVQETSTGNELIRETLSYEDYLDIEVLANKLGVHSHAITKDGIYTSNRNIGRYTVHESTLVHMPIYIVHLRRELTRNSLRPCISMNLKFLMQLLLNFHRNFMTALPL